MRKLNWLLCAGIWVLGGMAHAQLSPTTQIIPQRANNGTQGGAPTSQSGSSGTITNNDIGQPSVVAGQVNGASTPEPGQSVFRSPGVDAAAPNMISPLRNERTTGNALIRTLGTSEFSRYASKLTGQPLRVFGKEFFDRNTPPSVPSPVVPPEYLVNVGDEILVQITGALDLEFKQQVRRGGDITLPRVGSVRVAGVSAGDLAVVLRKRLESQFRDVQVSASLISLRGVRVYVTGFVALPGPYVIDSLSTITAAIGLAGGPAEGGSYRLAELWRKGQKVATFDLYQFLLKGDTRGDVLLTADDLIKVAPASSFQVAVSGSVNQPAVYELLPGEGYAELLAYAGGYTPVAERERLAMVEIDREGQRRLNEVRLGVAPVPLKDGSVVYVFSAAAMNQGINSTLKIVHVEGEVKRPGSYLVSATGSINDVVQSAGGYTDDAFAKGLTLLRPALAREQELLLNRSLDEIERSLFEASARARNLYGEGAQAGANVVARTYIEKLRNFKPTGRLIVSASGDAALRQPILQDGDRINIPSRPTSVAVYGSVYGEGSYLSMAPAPLSTFIKSAGGMRPGAARDDLVILKNDGSFLAPHGGWFANDMESTAIEPGDTIFVPTDADRGLFWFFAKELGTSLYQFGLATAALKALR